MTILTAGRVRTQFFVPDGHLLAQRLENQKGATSLPQERPEILKPSGMDSRVDNGPCSEAVQFRCHSLRHIFSKTEYPLVLHFWTKG